MASSEVSLSQTLNLAQVSLFHNALINHLYYTAPPGPLRNLRTTTITATSVTLSWTKPEVTGRDDFYYSIEYSDPNTGSFILSNGNYVNSALSYTVPNLCPYTPYTIRVTTHNGVSDQDTENEALRIAYLFIKTREGGKFLKVAYTLTDLLCSSKCPTTCSSILRSCCVGTPSCA